MATNPDIIVIDEEKYPHIATVGTKMGENLALEYYSLDDEQFQYIPPHIHYLRFDYNTASFGMRYWGEVRSMKSEYGVDEFIKSINKKIFLFNLFIYATTPTNTPSVLVNSGPNVIATS